MKTSEPIGVGAAWQVRYTWESLNDTPHPKFTYDKVASETAAINTAVEAIDRMDGNPYLRLVEVHWRHVGEQQWTKVE
jgi:hypothetical protein